MQRDIEFEVESIDKSGGFIGSLYSNKTENVALNLVKECLATVHSFSAEGLSWSRELFEAEVSRHIQHSAMSLAHIFRKLLNKLNVMFA